MREKLDDDRSGTTLHFKIFVRDEADGEVGVREADRYFTLNAYKDGRLGEIFVRMGKAGSSDALLDEWAKVVSVALQHGVGVEEIFGKHLGTRFGDAGVVKGVRGVDRCTSVLDLISRVVLARYTQVLKEVA